MLVEDLVYMLVIAILAFGVSYPRFRARRALAKG
jgi:hypothetical protein